MAATFGWRLPPRRMAQPQEHFALGLQRNRKGHQENHSHVSLNLAWLREGRGPSRQKNTDLRKVCRSRSDGGSHAPNPANDEIRHKLGTFLFSRWALPAPLALLGYVVRENTALTPHKQ